MAFPWCTQGSPDFKEDPLELMGLPSLPLPVVLMIVEVGTLKSTSPLSPFGT